MRQRPVKPETMNAPGLNWRPRKDGWIAYWVARPDLIKRGYSLKSARLWPPSSGPSRAEPSIEEWSEISAHCIRLQSEMLGWGNCRNAAAWDPRAVYDGTVKSLIRVYLNDPDSPFQSLRYHTKLSYGSMLRTLETAVGNARIAELTFRDFKRWHEAFSAPKIAGCPPRRARGHGLMTALRVLIAFGKLLKLAGCADAKETLSDMDFEMPKRRTAFITYEQVNAIRREAHRRGLPSMALAQAVMFELTMRPKDVLGERIPVAEPGVSEVTHHGKKWMHGLHWKEISDDLILTHRISKSLRGRDAISDPSAGKTETFDLKAYPMVMEELQHVTDRSGPVIVYEKTGRPWDHKRFAAVWRKLATAVDIPNNVQNRDSRAGGITEALDAGAKPDQVRRHAAHSQLSTTMGYSRGSVESKNNVEEFRVKNRPKTP